MPLCNFDTLTFDVYGTLIDWESGMIAGLRPLTDQLDKALSRNDILQGHAYHESTAQAQTPHMRYDRLLAVVYKRLAEEWGVSATWDEALAYGRSVRDWPVFADTVEALRDLKQHYRLVVLSNVDNDSFAASNEKLGVTFDAVYTAEDIGSYKPALRNFDYMLTQLGRRGILKEKILHVAESLFHDHQPARQFGLANCWIYRRHDQEGFGATMDPGARPHCDWVFNSMAELVEAHQRELT
ncbi:haloacid dehalogenase type II [Dichotomicrobium thermohalophilum]|uniref:2-haloacid dehalogenase n=1 Tax=Dichotomicrobium thermohalophilum TaxID=933063 RepID=A0A397Q2R1_9HYPH|nr:haloacid dehalogenase type II [Dichotomicrobium thermohalophilum]RIA55223.1 2-haloacid dehalogenase [Dichotomicrobium thermohalophilum]